MKEFRMCAVSGEMFPIKAEDFDFYQKISPTFGGHKVPLPPPKLSPLERQRRRLSFRNLRSLYHRSCDLSGKKIISMYAPDSGHKVFYTDEWWSDRWDPFSYGRPFDFNRPFFEQFGELLKSVPLLHAYVILSENCEYINGAANCKDCYLSFNLDYCEQCLYVANTTHAVSCIDCLNISQSELCYECVDCQNCYNLRYSEKCIGCSESAYLTECRQCRNCIGCCNLVNQENCLFNQKVSLKEIEQARVLLASRKARTEFARRVKEHARQYPRRFSFGYANENSSGYNIHHLRNSRHCFESFELENCSYCNYVFHSNNCMDYDIFGDHSQWIYESLATGLNAMHNLFCIGCWGGSANNLYCHTVSSSTNCFGCSGLRQSQFCILNVKYSKAEYEALLPKILQHMENTGEWGEFFPAAVTPFAYDETIAHEYFPLTRHEALARGYNWRGSKNSVQTAGNPDRAAEADLPDFPLKQFLPLTNTCLVCGKTYKLITKELEAYSRNCIPAPDQCPECRHAARRKRSVPFKLWESSCSKCNAPISTAYNPETEKLIYCEDCYRMAVY